MPTFAERSAETLTAEEAAQERANLDAKWALCFATQDDDLLHRLIYTEFGYHIPRVAVCERHDAPFTFVTDVLFGRVSSALVLANRSGGKTLNLALVHVLRSTVRSFLAGVGLDTAHVAAVNVQAKRCYDYVKLLNKTPFVSRYVKHRKELMSTTEYTTGAKTEILPGTLNAVNGPHPPFATFDEVELAPWDVVQEFMSMSQERGGVKAQDIYASTRKRVSGTMQRLLNEADERGTRVYSWCIFEVLRRNETCNDETCGIEGCGGRCTRSDGYYPPSDAAKKQRGMDKDTWSNQWESKKPGRSGLVYEDFEDEPGVLHVQEFDPATDHPQSLVGGEDFGFTNMDVALLGYWHTLPSGQRQLRIFDEVTHTKTKDSMVADAIVARIEAWGFSPASFDAWWCDPAGAGPIQERKDHDLPARTITDAKMKVIEEGVHVVRRQLSVNPRDGSVGLLIHPRCVELRRQLGLYSYPDATKVAGPAADKPIKKDDHGPDALRMLVVGESLGQSNTTDSGEVVQGAAFIDPYEDARAVDDEPF